MDYGNTGNNNPINRPDAGRFFTGPPERKVTAATGGAGAGVVVGQFVCWLLDVYVLTPGVTGDLPRPVEAVVTLAAGAAVALAAGYATRR